MLSDVTYGIKANPKKLLFFKLLQLIKALFKPEILSYLGIHVNTVMDKETQ